MATGWLGWPPDVAWRTPVPEILTALDARIEWVNMTNPFGSGDDKGGKGGKRSKGKPKARMSPAEMRKALREM